MNCGSLYTLATGNNPCDMLLNKTQARRLLKENPGELKRIEKWLSQQPHTQQIVGALFNIVWVYIHKEDLCAVY